MIETKNIKKPEILAPCGTKEAFEYAINNGCDAVYLGAKSFGARSYANNFEISDIEEAVKKAHIYGVNVYVTLNTLVKDIEFKELDEVLNKLSEIDIDGLILQDMGVYRHIRDNYPNMIVHASTQMNLHHINEVKKFKELGFSRVVLARETSLEMIKKIKEEIDIEIECFVHGALCYCYSGQCFMSSFYGGRSGNRGKCAQPCRLEYNVNNKNGYYISPSDLMTLELMPKLILSGIDSFKIEGRMKSKEYVGMTSKIYSYYRDLAYKLILEGKIQEYKVSTKDIEILMQLFNRGSFSTGYYDKHNSYKMITTKSSKNQGVMCANLSVENNKITIKAIKDIEKDDLLEIHTGNELIETRLGIDIKTGKAKSFNKLFDTNKKPIRFSKDKKIKRLEVYRVISNKLLNEINEKQKVKKVEINFDVEIQVNKEAIVRCTLENNKEINVIVSGPKVLAATNRPLLKADIYKQLNKLNATEYELNNIDINIVGDCFMRIADINLLRRQAVLEITNEILKKHELKNDKYRLKNNLKINSETKEKIMIGRKNNDFAIIISNVSQWELVKIKLKNNDFLSNLKYLYINIMDIQKEKLIEIINEANNTIENKVYLALPNVLLENNYNKLIEYIKSLPNKFEGFLIRNLAELEIGKMFAKQIHADYNLHVMNKEGLKVFSELGIDRSMLSVELNKSGIKDLLKEMTFETMFFVYGRVQLMNSSNCIYQTSNKRCEKDENGHKLIMGDRKNMKLVVKCHCNYCYNSIYNSKQTNLLEYWNDIKTCKVIDLTEDTKEEVNYILKNIETILNGSKVEFNSERYTRGHYLKGVK